MKIVFLGLAAVVCGVVAGYVNNRAEFSGVVESHFDPAASRVDTTNAAARGPRVHFVNGESHNFGTMEGDSRGTHVFRMKNIGDEPLNLEKGDTTCKCTVSEMENGSIAPGKSVEITLSWEVIDHPTGSEFRQIARFRTNDPKRPLIELLIHGFVSRSIGAIPEELVLNRLTANEESSAHFQLFAYQHDEFEVTSSKFLQEDTRDFFIPEFRTMTAAEIASEPRARAGVAVLLRILPGLPIGALNQTIRISTTLPDKSQIDVPIRGTVTSDISIVGRNFRENRNLLDLRTVRQDEGVTANLHILVKGPYRDDIELEVVGSDPEDVLLATIGKADRSNPKVVRFPLKIEIPAGARQVSRLSLDSGKAGSVTIRTTHPQAKEVRVLVRFAVEG